MEKSYLVIYDISNNARLNKVAKILIDYGFRVQKSVFELRLSESDVRTVEQRLRSVIQEEEDGVKIFPLCESCQSKKYGLGDVAFPERDSRWIFI